jgi:outer membrane protein TolC
MTIRTTSARACRGAARSHTSRHASALVLALTLGTGVPPLAAQAPTDTLRIADAIDIARRESPALIAARSGVTAATERATSAGALPDPVLSLGLMNRPIDGFGTDEPMTMNQVELSQDIPWPGTLGAMRREAAAWALAESHEAAEVEVMLLAQVIERYFTLAATDRTLDILARNQELLRDFFDVTTSRYEVGEAPQQDVLQAQVAVAMMSEEIIVLGEQRRADAARLNALLGRDAETPVPALELPPLGDELPSVDSLMAAATAGSPALRAAEARRRASADGVAVAHRERYPDLMLGVAWNQRPAFDDMASLMVGVRLPIRPGSRQQPRIREREAMAAGADAAAHELTNQTWASVVESRAAAERARSLGTLYRTAILPQATAAVDAALSGYRVGEVNYSTLVESQMTVNRYEIALVRITAEYHQAVARVDALLGRIGGEE